MKLRPVEMSDADDLLKWKNDPDTRKWAIVTHAKIKREDHIKWLRAKLKDFNTRFFIIMEGKEKLGDFRIEADGEVSIRIDKKHRGKHIASEVLKEYCPKGVYAKIVNGNVASMRLFLKNGFMVSDYKEGYYVLTN